MKASIGNRIVLIGAGDVGIAYGYALVNQGLADHLSIIDIDHDKLVGEVMDLNHGVVWAPSPTLVTEGTYDDCADATMVVICAGAAQRPGESRLDLVGRNMAIFEGIVGDIMATGFDGILLVATNPVDILAQASWRYSGLP
ncbi:MAG: L-lactate dehydrogenase, partial [Dietzia sp.]|nr:L-lactate dehydrogenase [Dietzia sp.]